MPLTAAAAGDVLRAMSPVPHLVIGVVTSLAMLVALVPVLVEVRAARARRRAETCAFDADERLPWTVRARSLAREAVHTLLALVAAPLTVGRRSYRGVNDASTRAPLVLVLGWGQHPVLWRRLVRRLHADGWGRLELVSWTTPQLSLDAGVVALGAAVARLRPSGRGGRVDVLAHGAGGLVVRAYLRTGTGDAVGRIVTLGTPHQGTEVATWRGVRALVGALAPAAPTITALAADDPVPQLADVVTLYSHEDALVLPPGNGYYAGAFGIEVRGVGHFGLLHSWPVYELVRENLAAETAPVRATATLGRRADA